MRRLGAMLTASGSRSTLQVVVGLGLFSAGGLGLLMVAGRHLGPDRVTPVVVAWNALNAIALGLYAAVEQNLARRVRAAGGSGGLRGGREGPYVVMSLAAGAVVAAAWPGAAELFFAGSTASLWLTVGAFGSHALAYLVRGVLAGRGRFGRYATQMSLDGVLRVVLAVAVARAGVADPAAYVAVLVVSPALSSVLTLGGRAEPIAVSTQSTQSTQVEHRFGPILAVTVASQLVANLGPLAIAPKAVGGPAVVAAFSYAVTIGRLPMLAFAAIQAVALPAMASRAAVGDRAGFGSVLRATMVGTLALAVAGVVFLQLAGLRIVELLYGTEFLVSPSVFGMVLASACVLMVAGVLAQALLALGADGRALVGWLAGLVALAAMLALPGEPMSVVALAMLGGGVCAGVVLGVALRSQLSSWPGVSHG